MSDSPLQSILLENFTELMRASRSRVWNSTEFLSEQNRSLVDKIVWEEIKGIIHGVLCEFDGATSLADHGLISIVDEDGNEFDRFLHELSFDGLTKDELQ